MLHYLQQPWPWYIAGAVIGLIVPALLILGNKHFGISSNLRHICAACFPSNIPFFKYNWRKEKWNFYFVLGIVIGAFIATKWLSNSQPQIVHPDLIKELATYGIHDFEHFVPSDLFNLETLFSVKGLLVMVVGGFLIGFGTRYAGGCTSGHSIMGLSNLQLPSLIATICFMIGGFIMANWILPFILQMP